MEGIDVDELRPGVLVGVGLGEGDEERELEMVELEEEERDSVAFDGVELEGKMLDRVDVKDDEVEFVVVEDRDEVEMTVVDGVGVGTDVLETEVLFKDVTGVDVADVLDTGVVEFWYVVVEDVRLRVELVTLEVLEVLGRNVVDVQVELREVRVVVTLRVLVEDTERLVEDRVLLLVTLVEDGTKDENELEVTVLLLGSKVGVDNGVEEFE